MSANLVFGLVGFPLGHSLSPRLHKAALNAMNKAGEYHLFPLEPFPDGLNKLERLLDDVRRDKIQGLNVTIPHKQVIMSYLEQCSLDSQIIGAVNTIYFRNGKLHGENTDAPGFIADLDRFIDFQKKSIPSYALILGAGGAARAVAVALLQRNWVLTIAARRFEQAQAMAIDIQSAFKHLSSKKPTGIRAVALTRFALENMKLPFSLIVNSTPVGMWPDVESSPWPEGMRFPNNCFVYDLVYNPSVTMLVHQAREAGLFAQTGLGMLVEQAALSLELWTGQHVDREPMWEAVPEFLPNSQKLGGEI